MRPITIRPEELAVAIMKQKKKGVLDQLGGVADQLDLEKRVTHAADRVGLTDQKKVLGVPMGRKRPDWSRIATYGAAAAAVTVAGVKALSGNGSGDDEGAREGSEADAGSDDES
jgi:hypothetical protein